MGGGSGVAVSCGVDHRRGLDLALLWLWRRPAAAAPIRPLAWELPYASGAALKEKKKNPVKVVRIIIFAPQMRTLGLKEAG